ncbi:putative protein kinase RLK-Pelle-LRR-VII-3 family [Rosa chinensis]|uniref:Protein kinase domain-containing protein n=1 Tax=Rosa chinensis TaxID=74649 RepID=A0A2P6PYY3_ROSCH|nr:putative protein kinase RLK-Pelle-LRR-VII-3 family [Rosa chinensis]
MATASFFFLIIPMLYFTAALTAGQLLLSEIQALTTFKLNLHDPLGALNGWDSSTPSAPCDWRGVVCFNNRVRELSLPRLHLAGRLGDQLASLRDLRKLNLHTNNFNGSIPPSLSQCALLRTVYLHGNSLSGDLPPALLNLTNLQILNLAHNSLSGRISGDIPASLRYLDLSSNAFTGDIPVNFSANSQLQLVNFSFNQFTGGVPPTIGRLQMLEYLWLDSNQLTGTLPSAISNCSSLIHFSADDNALRGLIPATIGAIPKLQVVSLARNSLSGSVPIALLCNGNVDSSSLRIVDLGFNALTGIVQPQNGRCSSILEGFRCRWKLVFGGLPTEIGNLFRLEELRVGNNSLSGEIPTEIAKCSLLQALDLEGNRFEGQFPLFLGGMRSLKVLSLGGNLISGTIPSSLGALSGLESLNLSGNNLTGEVPVELMQLSNLTSLNLSNNKFSGEVLGNVGALRSLQGLNLSNCGLSGSVPASVGSLMRLATLDLSKQKLSGELPTEIFGLPNLQVVALQENQLSGAVPQGFSSLTGLVYLNLSSNAFTGVIPATYGYLRSLTVLSLSKNRISGVIPPELGDCLNLQVLELSSNQLGDKIPVDISRLSSLEELDLGHNKLTGEIPEEISKCSALTSLLLEENQLSGPIPNSLPLLVNLVVLDLSSNQLIGAIPANISLIPHLKSLNLSNNNLSGKIPELLGSQFNGSVFAMNPKLCGKPLDRECGDAKRRRRNRLLLLIGVAAGGALLLLMCCCGYVYSLFRWRKKLREMVTGEKKGPSPGRASSGGERSGRGSGDNGGPKLVMFNTKITYAEALEATRQFDEENVLSRGKYGLVFKASFPDGMVLSIRRLPASSLGVLDEETFHKEAEALGKVKHRNLTVLRGYYAGPDVRLLVYDYMPNGNLATLLQEASHQDGHVLNWPMRHLIALGIARGIAFLHSVSMVHGDVKPQNVLFDADFEAHLSEFGLDRLTIVSPKASSSSSAAIGTLGYVSPEAALTGQATKEADVYSFGIVLLEILTGRKPVMFTEEEDIVKWVKKQLQRGQITELLEPGLLELDPESSESEEFLLGVKVGLLCTAPDPLDRPLMADIVFMLEGCRVGPDIPSSADPTSLPSPA